VVRATSTGEKFMKIFSAALLAIVSSFIFSSTAHADGKSLLKQCTSAEKFINTNEITSEFDIGMCFGLLQGVRNTMQILAVDGSIKICMPKNGIDNGQATKVVVSYLKDHPESLDDNAVTLIMLAMIDAYPCK